MVDNHKEDITIRSKRKAEDVQVGQELVQVNSELPQSQQGVKDAQEDVVEKVVPRRKKARVGDDVMDRLKQRPKMAPPRSESKDIREMMKIVKARSEASRKSVPETPGNVGVEQTRISEAEKGIGV